MVTLTSLEGGEISDFSNRLFERWGIGQSGEDNGALLLAAIEDRQVWIEVGYGLEAIIPDGRDGRILDEAVLPAFRQGQYGAGLTAGAATLALLIANSAGERAAVAGQLEGALGRLMVVMESYPELRSNQNFLALQDELAGTENRIAVERRRYNESIQTYNTAVQQFPASVIANMTGFDQREFFEAATGAETAPAVNF